jgi:hypothetical protein
MKTIAKSLIFMILILVLASAGSVFSATPVSNDGSPPRKGFITYKVNVHLSGEVSLCNTYMVVLRDGFGNLVAPPKPYVPGVVEYTFTQRGPSAGKRVASLIMSPYRDNYVCATQLFTSPAVRFGYFLNDLTYEFDLFPSVNFQH